jgi:LysM repeat protein
MTVKKATAWLGLVAVIAAAFCLAPVTTSAAPLAQSGNLVQNAGMELPYTKNKWPNGWVNWYQEIAKPTDASALQYALPPNYNAETLTAVLIHGGEASAHVGRQFDPWNGGLTQSAVVPANAQVRFCAWSRLYVQNTDFGKGEPSVTAMNGRSRVGIFPNGDAAWTSAGIVWSGEANPHDIWQQICVTTTAGPQGKVTVFTSNDYRGSGAIHLDAWWDDAELVTLGEVPTVQPTAAAGAVQPTTVAQPQPTALPPVTNPDGSIVHTIAAGDTLFGLSFQYNVGVDTLLALNGLTKDSLLSIGQKIIIKGGTGTAPVQPTAAPQPTAPVSPTAAAGQPAQPTSPPTAAAGQPAANAAKLCVRAYNDANSDGLLTEGEEPVAGVQFAVANSQGVQVASSTSDASGQEHCFTDLPPGSYTVAVQPATGTVAISDKRWSVALTGGSVVPINFGSRGTASAPATGTTPTTSGGAGLSGLLGGAIGLILLLVAGVLGAFIIARRRA